SARRRSCACADATAPSSSRRPTGRARSRRGRPGSSPPPRPPCGGPVSPRSSTWTRQASDRHTVFVKPTRAEQGIRGWGLRDVTPDLMVECAQLDAARELNGLVGKPIRRRLRNFRAEADSYLASLGGPLPYMRRLRQIEHETADHLERLEAAYAERGDDPAA